MRVAGRVAVMLWVIWKNRNGWVWNKEKKEANKLGIHAFHSFRDWFMAHNFRPDNNNEEKTHEKILWKPPKVGWVKCNVDAGFNV